MSYPSNRKAASDARVETVYHMLVSAAEDGVASPTNAEIIKRLGCASTNVASRCVSALLEDGRISIKSGTNARQVTITSTGKSTAPVVAARGRLMRLAFKAEPETFKIVNRDPCTFCGVRADVGCRHIRSAA